MIPPTDCKKSQLTRLAIKPHGDWPRQGLAAANTMAMDAMRQRVPISRALTL
ncbi:MAG: hypothetical protein J0H83_03585 [Candidatus Melainabacteria bacterium]|nr:hypothetical protein [Candidatus Melainabacteria bacterium]